MSKKNHKHPAGLVIAGLSGGSGKSVISVGITAALASQGQRVAPFKKGPDYIDAGWLQLAAGRSCHNLDPYLMSPDTIRQSCAVHSSDSDLIVVEGNRGLFDGVNVQGAYSTAELAAILNLPVVLVVDCTKTTRTVAALIMGCLQMGKDITISGVVLNRIGSPRHERIIRQSIEHYTDIPVVGALPRLSYDVFPQRHIGITPCPEYHGANDAITSLRELITANIDLPAVASLARPYQPASPDTTNLYEQWENSDGKKVTIGVIKDAAFQFYYPENLRALEICGAELIEINALAEKHLPELDGLYIGGGFPETSVRELSANTSFLKSLKENIEEGLPVYAECGGLLYLGSTMEVAGRTYPLAAIFPVSFRMEEKPQAHGYTILQTTNPNPFYPAETEIKGHEFRYSKVLEWPGNQEQLSFTMLRGTGFAANRDGLTYKNVLALYTHIHAFSTPEWPRLFIEKVKKNKK